MIEFLLCLLITVRIHELAHMVVALKCGIGVKAFSIGFGKPYLHKTIKGIDYRLSPLPFGGYCDIKGMESKKDKDDFLNHPYTHKFSVLIAGCLTNILLSFGIYIFLYKSIFLGLYIDWIFIKTIFTKNPAYLYLLPFDIPINPFLIQLSILNIFCGISNLLPIVPLDGGYLWYVLIESKLSKFSKQLLEKSGWIFLIGTQLWIIWYLYAQEIINLCTNWINNILLGMI